MPSQLDQAQPTWERWTFGRWHPEDRCFSHCFQSDAGQATDLKRQCEKQYFSTGKFSVYHTHPNAQSRCHDTCQVFGVDLPREVS